MREFFAHGSSYSIQMSISLIFVLKYLTKQRGARSEHGAEPMRTTIVVSPTFSRIKTTSSWKNEPFTSCENCLLESIFKTIGTYSIMIFLVCISKALTSHCNLSSTLKTCESQQWSVTSWWQSNQNVVVWKKKDKKEKTQVTMLKDLLNLMKRPTQNKMINLRFSASFSSSKPFNWIILCQYRFMYEPTMK